MILHRIASAIRRQDWFQVALEILIVVIGIFLGLQVSEWNDGRVERAEEVEYIARLHEDFSQSLSVNESRVLLAYNQWEDGKRIVDILSSCQLDDNDKDMFARGLFGAGKFLPVILNRTTIDELNSTGKFQTIQNVDLRKAISEHVYDINTVSNLFNMMNDGNIPHLVILENNYSYNLFERDPRYPEHDVSWDSIEIEFEQVCNNDQFKGSITHIFQYVNGIFSYAHPILEKQRAIIAMLEAEMGKNN